MKPFFRHILEGLVFLSLPVLWGAARHLSGEVRRQATCQGVETVIRDSASLRFVSPEDVKGWMDDYGTYVGLRLDSVDLDRVERIILSKSAVRSCEAYLTDDGVIHVELSQRPPVVRFATPAGGYYCDAGGYIFPLHNRFSASVPIVDGVLPLTVPEGFKGELEDPAERAYLRSVIALVGTLKGSRWEQDICQISVRKGGEIILVPREGTERFRFGQPVDIAGKLDRLEKYYTCVAPSREKPAAVVDLRFKGQIICQ